MSRSDLERLSKEELIELVLKLHRPERTSCTSPEPPATDRKERREKSRPGGAKPEHEGHKRALTSDPNQVVDHRPASYSACGEVMAGHRPAVWISDRYSAQQGHGERQQTCLTRLARDGAYALDASDDLYALRFKWWLDNAIGLARHLTELAASTLARR